MKKRSLHTEKRLLSRREFLEICKLCAKYVTLALLGVVSGIRMIDTRKMQRVSENETIGATELQENISFLEEIYGLNIYTGFPVFVELLGYTAQEQDLASLSRSAAMLRQAASLYPQEFFRNNGIQAFSFIKNLQYLGKRYGGFAIPFDNLIVLDEPKLINLIHHEIRHTLDYGTNPLAALVNEVSGSQKQEWDTLYFCSCDPYTRSSPNDAVFAYEYGKLNDAEDRATIAEFLMEPEFHKHLLLRIEQTTDPETEQVLTEKINRTKQLYFEKSNGKMNDRYWQDLIDGKVGEGYFS